MLSISLTDSTWFISTFSGVNKRRKIEKNHETSSKVRLKPPKRAPIGLKVPAYFSFHDFKQLLLQALFAPTTFRGPIRQLLFWVASVATRKRAVIEKCLRVKVIHFENE